MMRINNIFAAKKYFLFLRAFDHPEDNNLHAEKIICDVNVDVHMRA